MVARAIKSLWKCLHLSKYWIVYFSTQINVIAYWVRSNCMEKSDKKKKSLASKEVRETFSLPEKLVPENSLIELISKAFLWLSLSKIVRRQIFSLTFLSFVSFRLGRMCKIWKIWCWISLSWTLKADSWFLTVRLAIDLRQENNKKIVSDNCEKLWVIRRLCLDNFRSVEWISPTRRKKCGYEQFSKRNEIIYLHNHNHRQRFRSLG